MFTSTDRFAGFPKLYPMEDTDNAVCCACGSEIFPEEEHYKIGEDRYCMDCGAYADEAILEAVRDNFIIEGI